MNRKGLLGALIGIILICFLIYIIYLIIPQVYFEVKHVNAYKDFCEKRYNFCYCNWMGCEFRVQKTQKYLNGSLVSNEFSEDTIAICNLAKKLNDKKMLFKIGCDV
jgi:hypothetical protein